MFSLVYLKYLYIFLSFVLTFGLMQALARQNNIRIFFEEFGSKLSQKAFPGYSQTTFNLYSLLRIFFAVIILLQAWNASILLLPNERFELVGIIYGVELIAGIFLFFGFFTQYILIFFIGLIVFVIYYYKDKGDMEKGEKEQENSAIDSAEVKLPDLSEDLAEFEENNATAE